MSAKRIVSPAVGGERYAAHRYSAAVAAAPLLFLSGQIGTDAAGQLSNDPECQFAQAFENVSAVLAAEGLDFSDLVDLTTYHVGMGDHFVAFQRVKNRYLSDPYPAWTAIGVDALAVPGALVEIRTIAMLRD